MGTEKVKLEAGLNKAVWAKGIRNIPRRIRVRISRQLDDEEDRQDDYISVVSHVDIPENERMSTRVVTDLEE